MMTRRLHEKWVHQTERYWSTKQEADRPRPLMITIEEAHKFLNADAAHQTSFGTIARELRKFYVTLLVVDQRPSGIDPEVLSQIGTRITCQLNDERDIDAIFTGVSGGSHLRTVLATLDSREQALVLGHALPMPMMVPDFEHARTLTDLPAGVTQVVVLDSPLEVAAQDRPRVREVLLREQPRVSVWVVDVRGARAVEHGYRYLEVRPI